MRLLRLFQVAVVICVLITIAAIKVTFDLECEERAGWINIHERFLITASKHSMFSGCYFKVDEKWIHQSDLVLTDK